jgi:hypothetical protein
VGLWFGTSGTSERLSSQKRLKPVPLPTDSCPLLTAGQPVDAAVPAAVRFHGVSCPIV